MRLLVIIGITWSAAAAAIVMRSGCDKDDSTIATVSDDTPIRVHSAIAGSSLCYSISAVVGQQKIDGYTIDSTLPAVVEFEEQRLAAFRKANAPASSPVAAAPPQAAPPGSRFPDFVTRDLSGKPVSLSGGRGKVMVVTFWSPSNPRSLSQMTGLRGLYAEFHPAGLDAIGVAMTRSDGAARAALDDIDLDWPQISDQVGLARSLNIGTHEAKTFVLDENRNIIASDLHGPELTALVSKMLRGAAR